VAPKVFARLVRFRHAVKRIGREDLAVVAAACGFSDQSPLPRRFAASSPAAPRNRVIRAFAGVTPTELVALPSPSSKTAELRAA
jgi:hypothetical protein